MVILLLSITYSETQAGIKYAHLIDGRNYDIVVCFKIENISLFFFLLCDINLYTLYMNECV